MTKSYVYLNNFGQSKLKHFVDKAATRLERLGS